MIACLLDEMGYLQDIHQPDAFACLEAPPLYRIFLFLLAAHIAIIVIAAAARGVSI
jgi:hypothetical protein